MRYGREAVWLALLLGAIVACESAGHRHARARAMPRAAGTGGSTFSAGAGGWHESDAGFSGTGTGGAVGAEPGSAGEGGAIDACAEKSQRAPLLFEAPPFGDPPARYYPPTRWSLGPIFGSGCPLYGGCETRGRSMASEVDFHLDQLALHDIPITVYHFDGEGWSDGACGWNLGDALRDRLAALEVRALVHYWGGCRTVDDFERLYAGLGPTLAGLYLDDGLSETDEGASDALTQAAIDWTQARLPGDAEVVLKAYRTFGPLIPNALAAYGHSSYVNDLPSDFGGLKTGIERVLSLATTLPAPFNEFTAYDFAARPDEETYFRRIHFGALQPVMDHSPFLHASPWEAGYSSRLLADFRYFAWLHYEFVPYLHSYDYRAYQRNEPILRSSDPSRATTKLGDEIFVAYVTEPGLRELSVTLPPGEWLDYWDPSQVYTGTITRPVPLGREPIFIANGSIIPMQVSRDYTGHGTRASAGSLTLLVYPKGQSRFWYREDARDRWLGLGAELDGDVLTLVTTETPSQPLLYRIERFSTAPKNVQICGERVTVNGNGTALPPAASEDAVNGSSMSAWYYDAAAHRLIVKSVP